MAAKKRRRINWPAIILLMITLLIIGGCVFIYIYGNQTMIRGKWQREVDVTDYAHEAIEQYLGENSEDESENEGRILITLTLEIDDEGNWVQSVDEDTYNIALILAKEILSKSIIDNLKGRIDDAYIKTDMSVEELIKEATGMDIDTYLAGYGPKLLPDYSELSQMYGINASYTAGRDEITFSDGSVISYVVTKDILVTDRTDEVAIYHKEKEAEDEQEQ